MNTPYCLQQDMYPMGAGVVTCFLGIPSAQHEELHRVRNQ